MCQGILLLSFLPNFVHYSLVLLTEFRDWLSQAEQLAPPTDVHTLLPTPRT